MSVFQEYFVETITKRYADFSGRARRSEYWYYTLFSTLIFLGVAILGGILVGATESPLGIGLIVLLFLPLIIPSLAVTVRRLHDSGKSGWFLLLQIVPFGGLVIFIFTVLDSEPQTNRWGPNPKSAGLHNAADHLIEKV